MDPSRWQRIEALFHQVADLPRPLAARALRAACVDELSLIAEVEALLARGDRQLSPREIIRAELDTLSRQAAAAYLGRRVGAFRLIALLGQGGMGAVYLAERADDEFAHRVAIKLLPRGLRTHQLGERLRSERQILATLEHPGIVRLLDGGTDDDGTPYLVMEYVRGATITGHARAAGLTVRQKVALLRKVCSAIEHAHQRFVAHRDLKPTNILVDETGAPKVLDFGIAALLAEAPQRARNLVPGRGEHAFSPPYSSPEQVRGAPATATSDVYSLGAVLYELLAGRPPLLVPDNLAELSSTVAEIEPPLASDVAPARDRRVISGELDCILRCALHKDPDRRYASVAALAADLDRFLACLPVAANPPSLRYRARKALARNRRAVTATASIAVALSMTVAVVVQRAQEATCMAAQAAAARAHAALPPPPRSIVQECSMISCTSLDDVAAVLERTIVTSSPRGEPSLVSGPARARAEALVSEAVRVLREQATQPGVSFARRAHR